MKKIAFIFCIWLLSMESFAGNARVFLYGFAASFSDSTVYFTDLQPVEQATITKGNFLYGRESYSNQLRDYLASQGYAHATCITVWATSREALEKKFQRMRSRYIALGTKQNKRSSVQTPYVIKYLTPDEFKFSVVQPEREAQPTSE